MELEAYGHNKISIHALREEGDSGRTPEHHDASNFYPRPPRGGRHYRLVRLAKFDEFLSTPSARRATDYRWEHCNGRCISIHALREEGDPKSTAISRKPS